MLSFKKLTNRTKYSENYKHSNAHICGQTKLYFGELLFFVKIFSYLKSQEKVIVLYIGSAPGIHIYDLILKLNSVFTNLEWHLFDNQPHCPLLKSLCKCVQIFERYFTNTDCEFYAAQKSVVLINDVRTNLGEKYPQTLDILTNTKDSITWCKKIQPEYMWLKFRPPYDCNEYYYFDGKLYLQAYNRANSTELRLFVTKEKVNNTLKKYDCLEIEEKLCYFNRHIKQKNNILYVIRVIEKFNKKCKKNGL